MKYKQLNLDQTGLAILLFRNGEEKELPLYSLNPFSEANDIVDFLEKNRKEEVTLKKIFYTNNLVEPKIEDTIEEYMKGNLALPEDYIDELVSGFPYILGEEPAFSKAYYS